MKNCELFDRYRDGDLNDFQNEEFQRHLATCQECRTMDALLDDLASSIRHETVPTVDMSDKITRCAFQRISCWDSLLACWLRPRFAFMTACLSIALCVFIWFAPENQMDDSMTYEMFLDLAESSDPARELLAFGDNDFVLMLIHGGDIQ